MDNLVASIGASWCVHIRDRYADISVDADISALLDPHQLPINLHAERVGNQLRQAASSRPFHAKPIVGLLAIVSVVQFALPEAPDAFAQKAQADPKSVQTDSQKKGILLPKNVEEMRDMLLAATESARVEELLTPYEWNELPPVISKENVDDPIAYWKKVSRDGSGLEILNIIDKLLHLPPAKLNVGPDHENSALYVWPYLSELDLANLTPRQQFELRTLVPPAQARKIFKTKKWSWWRLAIGADGTWHSFMKHDH